MNKKLVFYRNLSSLFLVAAGHLTAQATILKGTVTDETNNEPLIGATILASKTGNGTVTDIDGNYLLNIPQGIYDITAKSVGYRDFTANALKVNGDTLIYDITMLPDVQSLGEVVVTAAARHDSEVSQVQEQKKVQWFKMVYHRKKSPRHKTKMHQR